MDSSHSPKSSTAASRAVSRAPSPSTINVSTSDTANTSTTVPKLRDSCVACAASKVRCHRQKPSCSKCVARGITCKYVRSKRGGRNPAPRSEPQADKMGSSASSTSEASTSKKGKSSGGTETPPSTGPVVPPQSCLPLSPISWMGSMKVTHDAPFPTPATVSMFMNTKPSCMELSDSLDLSPSIGDLTSLDNDADQLLSSTANFDFDLDLSDPDPFSMVLNEQSDNDMYMMGSLPAVSDKTCSPPLSVNIPQCPVRPPFGFQADILQHINGPQQQGSTCECSIQAAALVNQYMTDSSISSSRSSSATPPPTTSQIQPIIFQNKQAIETIEAILRCSCSRDGYLLVMLCMILLKVMDSYADASNNKHTALARANDLGGDDTDEGGSTSSDQNKSLGRLRALQTPSPASYGRRKDSISIFGCPGAEDAGSARSSMHMVLGELHRPQRLVNQLCERLKAGEAKGGAFDTSSSYHGSGLNKWSILGGGAGISAQPSSGFLSDTLLRQLGLDLRTRLQKVSQEIRQALKREWTG